MKLKNLTAPDWQVRGRIWARVVLAANGGGWFCEDCRAHTERQESDQGQPASCARCGSHKINYVPPAKDVL